LRILSDELYTLVLEISPTLNIQGFFFYGGGRFIWLHCFVTPCSKSAASIFSPTSGGSVFILNVGRQTDCCMKFGVVDSDQNVWT